ncbi:MAG: hypothetical protein LOY01_13165 [Brachybacterium paraconglomeratum]|nr:hypothetical protein [Brachybacterium paraconglomeratum]
MDLLFAAAETEPDPRRVAELSGEAVEVFRGLPFADAGEGYAVELVAPSRAFWSERLANAVELRAAALIATGVPSLAVPDLRRHVETDPLRERAWALLGLGLADAGEPAGALGALRAAREALSRELGVRPGPLLTELTSALEEADGIRLARVRDDVLGRLAGSRDVARSRRGPAARGGRLPVVGDAFVDRRAELALLDELTATHPVTTVSGPGGVGKSRLVIEWAHGHSGSLPVWFAPLASRRGRNAVALAVCRAARLEGIFDNAVEAVRRWASGREGVLVLDNCEHLLDQVRTLVLELRRVAPGLVVVATSRHGLGLAGEAILGLEGLAADVPGSDGLDAGPDDAGPEDATNSASSTDRVGPALGPAVELLVDRIRARRAGWSPSPAERADLRRLATSLDGLPLALELAAVRSRAQSISDLAEGVAAMVASSGPVPVGSPSPHATLATAIDWSVDLLPPDERDLLLRLTPFAGGFTAETATEIWGRDASPLLVDMVDRSVVQADPRQSPTRFSLLETVRMRCAERDPQPEASRDAHGEWVGRLAARWFERSQGPRSSEMAQVLRAELPNIRAALTHDAERHPRRAITTLAGLDCWWYRSCLGDELMWWTQTLGPSAGLVPPGLRVRLALLHVLGLVMVRRDAAAKEEFGALVPAVENLSTDDDDAGYCRLLLCYMGALLELHSGNVAAARSWALRGADLAQGDADWPWFEPVCRVLVAGVDLGAGHVDRALAEAQQWQRVLAGLGMRWGIAAAGRVLAMALLAGGDAEAALTSARVALRHNVEDLDVSSGVGATMVVARCLVEAGDPFEAAVLADGMRVWARGAGARWDVVDGAIVADLDVVLSSRLDPAERRAAAAEAKGLRLAALQERALGGVAGLRGRTRALAGLPTT